MELHATIADLQANQIVQSTLLEALVMTHPDPTNLRFAWDRLVASRAADLLQRSATHPTQARSQETMLLGFQDWTGRLERHFPNPQ